MRKVFVRRKQKQQLRQLKKKEDVKAYKNFWTVPLRHNF